MMIAPACFILPLCWGQYENIIINCLEGDNVAMISDFKQLSKRNLKLQRFAVDDLCCSNRTEEQQLVTLLDEFPPEAELGSMAHVCLEKFEDRALIISTCLCWATGLSRTGSFRIYVVVRLFRMWAKLRVEVEGPLLNFLTLHPNMPPPQKVNVYKVLAELVHSKDVSVSKYLQRLMAKGSLAGCKNADGVRIRFADVEKVADKFSHFRPMCNGYSNSR